MSRVYRVKHEKECKKQKWKVAYLTICLFGRIARWCEVKHKWIALRYADKYYENELWGIEY